MLIPSIDLMGGRVVQLEQGERLAIATDDLDGWISRFARYPTVQLIDLDAARGTGHNRELVKRVCRQLPCQVGGGVRTPDQALDLIASGARRVIVGSTLFKGGIVNLTGAEAFSRAIGRDALIAAIDSRGGHVVVDGWKTTLSIGPAEAIAALDPFAGAFLYTHVDTEGLLTGLDEATVTALRATTTTRLIVAGGIRSMDEVNRLDRLGLDAVVGMAIYRGLISLE
jgi:phosphoribosylformimino-5-aminoimidazole carboxamide ribotide isomerase